MPSSTALKYVLAIDMGSGSTKAAVVSSAGEVVASAIRHTDTMMMAGGAVEQDPEQWWRSVCDAAKEAIAASRVPVHQIIAVACTTLWAVTVAVDEDGAAIGNAISWMDTRGAKYNRAVAAGWPRVQGYGLFKLLKWLRFTGGAPVQSGVDGLATDALGRLSLSHAGLRERDRKVCSLAKAISVPLVITLGGGYSKPIEHTALAHANTFRTAAEVFQL